VEDQILPAPGEEDDADIPPDSDSDSDSDADAFQPVRDPALAAADQALAASLSLPLRFMELATAAQDGGSRMLQVLNGESLPIRLAVYQKLLGAEDESYPDAWLDPATGELPTLQQLAALDRISMPTLRKRRNEAIDKLYAMNGRMQK
jgi:hypothetical protein